jgi:hypothetical protein
MVGKESMSSTDFSENTTPPSLSPVGEISMAKSPSRIAVITDGECMRHTLENLRQGTGAKPLSDATMDGARRQAIAFLEGICERYETQVAKGEVGFGGSGVASSARPIALRTPTGLLYGRVQSGKTLAMITLAAAAFDNKFKLVVVLTSNYVKLVEQTAGRFRAIDGRKIYDSTRSEDWQRETEHIRRQLDRSGVLIVCAKDSTHIQYLVELLETVGAANYPALIFDDEADQATPDTTTAARASAKSGSPTRGSAIFRRVVSNDDVDEIGQSVREKLRHNVFVQVTATPYALLLQNADTPLKPSFTFLVKPGDGYTGGESFFSERQIDPDDGGPPLVLIPDEDSKHLAGNPSVPPLGLRRAIAFFLVSAGAQQILNPRSRQQGQNFLCHTSMSKAEHEKLRKLLADYLPRLEDELPRGLGTETWADIAWAHAELLRTLPHAPSLADIAQAQANRLHLRSLVVVNSDNGNASFESGLNFIIGGNILGRGLTIDNLLVTYYLRQAKVTQMDTMLQHARMFGYRRDIMGLTRVFLTKSLALRFHGIHDAEQALRDQFVDSPNPRMVRISVVKSMKPTRTSVLDSSSLGTFTPGQHLYPYEPVFRLEELRNSVKKIDALIEKVTGVKGDRFEFAEISFADMQKLIELVPVSDADEIRWNPQAIGEVLKSLAEDYDSRGLLSVRPMERAKRTLSTGALQGDALKTARAKARPVLCLFKDSGQRPPWDGVPFYYPSIVFPDDMSTQVFSIIE